MLQLAAERAARVVGVDAQGRRVGEGERSVALGEQVLVERGHLDDLVRVRVRVRVRARVRVSAFMLAKPNAQPESHAAIGDVPSHESAEPG